MTSVVLTFTEDIALCLSHCSGVQFLPTCSAVKTSFVVYLQYGDIHCSEDMIQIKHKFALKMYAYTEFDYTHRAVPKEYSHHLLP